VGEVLKLGNYFGKKKMGSKIGGAYNGGILQNESGDTLC
jgi:hypothetical protein